MYNFDTASLSFHKLTFSTTVFCVKIAPFFFQYSTDKKELCLYNNRRTAHACLLRRFGTPWRSLSPSGNQ